MEDLDAQIQQLQQLTQREREVLALVCDKGKSYSEVAKLLIITKRTVQFHMVNVHAKLGITAESNWARQKALESFCAALRQSQQLEEPTSSAAAPEPAVESGSETTEEPVEQNVRTPEAPDTPDLKPELALERTREDIVQGAEPAEHPPSHETLLKHTHERGLEQPPRPLPLVVPLVLSFLFLGIVAVAALTRFGSAASGSEVQPSASRPVITQKEAQVTEASTTTISSAPTAAVAAVTRSVDGIPNAPVSSETATPVVSTDSGVCGRSDRIVSPPRPDHFMRSQGVSTFTVATTSSGVLADRVRAVTIDARGLWLGYAMTEANAGGGVGHFDKNTWSHCSEPGGPHDASITALAIDKLGRVWVGVFRAGVAMFDGKEWVSFTVDDGLPSDDVLGLTIDESNNVWLATWGGIAKYNGKIWSVPYTRQNGTIYSNHVHTVLFDQAADIWVGHVEEGVSRLRKSDGAWVHYTASDGLAGNKIRAILAQRVHGSSESAIWIATADGGVSKFQGENWTTYRVEEGLPSNDVRALALDKYGRVWVATTGGTAYFNGRMWTTYDTLSTLSIAFGPACQACPFSDDEVVTGTEAFGVTHSRLPYLDEAINVIEVQYPKVVQPGDTFAPLITIVPRVPYQLRQDRGDFLAVTSEEHIELFGLHPHIGVEGTVESGQPFTFVDERTPFRVPQLREDEQEKTFTVIYRLWMHTRYAGPPIPITFTVRKPVPTLD